MEVYIYNTELELEGVIDEIISFIWTRRYWSAGEFKLLAPMTAENAKLLVKNNLITKRGEKEMAQIRYIKIAKNRYGLEEIEVQGSFITIWLNNRVMLEQIITTSTSQEIMNRIVLENVVAAIEEKRRIPLIELEENQEDLESGVISYSSEPFSTCLVAIESAAKAAKLGFYIHTDVKRKAHIFKIYKGNDFTSKSESPCLFSHEFDNIIEQEYINSVENYKNVCYLGGEDVPNTERHIVKVGEGYGLDRIEFFVEAVDISQTYFEGDIGKTIPLDKYLEMLKSRAESELAQKEETLNFSSKINFYGNLKYRVDFDVGDRVTCIDKKWGLQRDVRITELTESYQSGKIEIDVTFGESLPTLFDKITKMR